MARDLNRRGQEAGGEVDGRSTERSSIMADFLEQIKRAREAAERPAPDQERMKPVEADLRRMAGEER
jgi:hypothetical protein